MPSPFALILFCNLSRENHIFSNNNNNNNVYLRLLLLLLLLSNIDAYIVSTRWNRLHKAILTKIHKLFSDIESHVF